MEKLRRVKLRQAAHRVVGSLRDVETPGWETSESTAAWVRASRQLDDVRLLSLRQSESRADPS